MRCKKHSHVLGSLLPPMARTLSKTLFLQFSSLPHRLRCSPSMDHPHGKKIYFNINHHKSCTPYMPPTPASSIFLLLSTPIPLQSLDYIYSLHCPALIFSSCIPSGPHFPRTFSTTYILSKPVVNWPFSSYSILLSKYLPQMLL